MKSKSEAFLAAQSPSDLLILVFSFVSAFARASELCGTSIPPEQQLLASREPMGKVKCTQEPLIAHYEIECQKVA